jgi:hypothetical protein
MRVSKDFDVREFVPPSIWNRFGTSSTWFIRPEIISLAQFYRDWFEAPVRVNDWAWGGRFTERGFRLPTSSEGASLSQHKFGCAFDCTIDGLSADEVREEILQHEKEFMEAGLTTLESGDFAPTWVHSDIRNTGQDKRVLIVGA